METELKAMKHKVSHDFYKTLILRPKDFQEKQSKGPKIRTLHAVLTMDKTPTRQLYSIELSVMMSAKFMCCPMKAYPFK